MKNNFLTDFDEKEISNFITENPTMETKTINVMANQTAAFLQDDVMAVPAFLKEKVMSYYAGQQTGNVKQINWWNYKVPIYKIAVAASVVGLVLASCWWILNNGSSKTNQQIIYVEKKDTIYVPASSADVNTHRTAYTIYNPKTGRYEEANNQSQVANAIDSVKKNNPLSPNKNNHSVGSLEKKKDGRKEN